MESFLLRVFLATTIVWSGHCLKAKLARQVLLDVPQLLDVHHARAVLVGDDYDLVRDLEDLPFATDLVESARSGQLNKDTLVALEHGIQIREKPMLWVHVHKAGGTFMCSMAGLAGENVVQPNDNCNWHGHDSYLDSGHTDHAVSCEDREAFFSQNGYTWGQIERELWNNDAESDLCWNKFDYGVMLRDPISLMRSMMNFHPDIGKGFVDDIELELKAPSETTLSQDPLWKYMDNFHIRVLASAMDVPAGQIDATHLEKAKERLAKFDTIARLEDLGDKSAEVFVSIGWSDGMSSHVSSKSNTSGDQWDFTAEELEWLSELNKYDYELYKQYGS